MFPDFEQLNIEVEPSITIHGIKAGSGPPLLLLHGFPQNLSIWHKLASQLTSKYTVIALDLRGYGQSSKPPTPDDDDGKHTTYGKTAMSRDCIRFMEELGYDKFFVCAHDRGARVAHRLCVDYPTSVIKAIFLDICPTLAMYSKTNFAFAKAYAHWFFLIKPAPFPEKLILGSPRAFIEGHMGGRHGGMEIFDAEALDSYVKGMSEEDGVHGMCEDYRASASIDMEEAQRDVEQGKKIECPLLVLWGKYGVVEALFNAVEEWKSVSEGSVEGEAVESGHYIPEEVPEVLLGHIQRFLV